MRLEGNGREGSNDVMTCIFDGVFLLELSDGSIWIWKRILENRVGR